MMFNRDRLAKIMSHDVASHEANERLSYHIGDFSVYQPVVYTLAARDS